MYKYMLGADITTSQQTSHSQTKHQEMALTADVESTTPGEKQVLDVPLQSDSTLTVPYSSLGALGKWKSESGCVFQLFASFAEGREKSP